MRTVNNNAMKMLGALVIGAATGATMGVLFAPRKGANTRKKIMNKGSKLAKEAKKVTKHEAKILRKEVHKLEQGAMNKLEELKNNIVKRGNDKDVDKVLDGVKN